MANPLLADTPGETHLLLGNEAIVRGAIEAGVQVVTCYPGTPSSEVPDTFFRISPDGKFYFEYSVNEKVALEVAGGATLSGAMTLCTMKHVGVNVAADPLMTMCYTGAPGGLMLLSADDPGCHSSQNEQDNRIYARIAGMPVLEPATAQEAKDMTRDGLALSKKYGAPILLRTTTRVNHLRGSVEFGHAPDPGKAEGFKRDPSRFVPIPAFARPMHIALMERMENLRHEAEHSPYNTVSGDGEIGIICSGISRAYVADALEHAGLTGSVKVLELGFSNPMPENLCLDFIKSVTKVLVVEELEPVVENEIRVLAQKNSLDVEIIGKDVLPRNGEFSVTMVENVICEMTGNPLVAQCACELPQLPVRPPNLCAGCPHRGTYFAAKKVFGDEAIYSSDIGCYTLGILPPLQAADFLLCMGSSISAGCGAAKAADQTVVAFIGDSTFFHSGLTGVANAVFNSHDILLVVLDNRTTAMTGHQPHPGVDKTILGDNDHPLDIESAVRGLGVTEIRNVNPFNQKKTLAAFEELKAMKGVRVLIAKEPCPLYSRRVYKKIAPQVAYVADSCTGRFDCLDKLACPAMYKEGDKAAVNPILCNGCMLCLQVCGHIKAKKRGS
ncbi:indolepyruvate ferredoxin oxidoreductase subunit alpha [Pseudodesulfovibrio piezophilus]|uniref:Indolepyruvate oxidoreductase subunit IorA n=1 Tax=Pseudodesulfovibrio piezophilus (strain DSM 21447 / JCM 15486 / C1TLV30) TaxID=1322246 RepID=M1WRB3_PSEP2|nr:indolepyruvate ferredoxin oxidoreductase subunit alpha [Pseudodesulfovibrio piezophilus]CCH48212.1 Indolepyruvate oxidoreductase subunit iorA [Pseudodesulfovibrio piezophilus C1TLV30]